MLKSVLTSSSRALGRDCFVALLLAMTIYLILPVTPVLASGFLSFDQKINIGPTSTLVIQETIKVDFATNRHGIYRDIPVRYAAESGNPFSLRVNILSVTDESGLATPYATSRENSDLRVKIGDPDSFVTGRKTYVITYSVDRALLYLSDHDELYWNAVVSSWGDLGWPDQITVAVALPGEVAAKDIRTRCFTGLGQGAPEDCVKSTSKNSAQFSVNGSRPLTIVVGWPKGVVAKPALLTEIGLWVKDNWVIVIPIISFLALFMFWYKKGRDPKPQGPLVVQYDPPENATPGEVGVLWNQRAGMQEITATVVHLAVKGYLNIIESKEKGLLGTKQKYSFELKKPGTNDAALTDHERQVLSGIFVPNDPVGTRVELSELENKFYKTAVVAKKQMADAAVVRNWFAKSPLAVRATYMGTGGAYCLFAFWLLFNLVNGPVAFISIISPGIFLFIFGYFMPARTGKGTQAYAHAVGFKEYLSKAETYRLKWQEKENIFEAFLPYAMIYGVVDKWAKAFEGMNMQTPSWYQGGTLNAWTPLMFVHSLNSATSTMGQAMMVAPSARGGGGFGGGGGGGGGFGGGGGGSW